MGCGVFKQVVQNLKEKLPKNQHTQTKSLNLRIGLMGKLKFEYHFRK